MHRCLPQGSPHKLAETSNLRQNLNSQSDILERLPIRICDCTWRTAIHKTVYFALFLGMVIEMARKCAQPHRCVFNGYSDGNAIHTNFQRGPPWPNGMYSRFAAVANRNRISARNATLVCTRCLDPNAAIQTCAQWVIFRWQAARKQKCG